MDYDPLLFWDYIWKGIGYDRKIHAFHLYDKLNDCIAMSPNAGRKRPIQRTSYILHIYVDTTTLFVKSKPPHRKAKFNIEFTIVYARVIDILLQGRQYDSQCLHL